MCVYYDYIYRDGWVDIMSTPILACTVRYEYFPMYVLTDYAYMEMMDELVNKPDNQWNLNFSDVSISDNQITYSNVSKPDDRCGTIIYSNVSIPFIPLKAFFISSAEK